MALRTLIVEDDSDANDLLAILLKDRGCDPIQTYTGSEALELAQDDPPDLMMLDLMLPDIDGFEVCETLRTHRKTNLIPIVMVTALAQQEHQVHGFRVGANAYLVKPYTSDQLSDAMTAALNWKKKMEDRKVEGEITFEISSDTEFLIEVNDLLSSLLLLTPLDEGEATSLKQALLEMGQNAIEWGNQHDVDKIVKITYRLHDDHVEIVVEDQGPGFDTDNIPHAAQEADPVSHMAIREILGLREGGFGILLSRGLVDHHSYNEQGNQVTLVKRFAPASS